jgi:Zn-dependent peptidase ImmA (M78 family)
MKTFNSHANPKILSWARKKNGLSIKQLAEKMKRDPNEIENWEKGTASPTYTMLENLAYKHFKIPLAVFFFPEPPDIEDPEKKFRILPDYKLKKFSSDTFQKIRLAQAYIESLEELMSDVEPKNLIFKDIEINKNNVDILARKIRNYIGISLDDQFSYKSNHSAFKAWRRHIEKSGIFTFKDSFKDRFISGFCMIHEKYPIIFINNSNSWSRQIFTLLHELCHIIFNVNGITDIDDSYIDYMTSKEKLIEIKCNKLASEILVPIKYFENEIASIESVDEQIIENIAEKYSVSREVILRRLLDYKIIDNSYYKEKSSKWNQDYLRTKDKRHGGNYYFTKLAYLGEGYTRLAFQNYYQGRIDKIQLSTHLNIKARYIDKLENRLGW